MPIRETFADELRGFALLGIVLVNAPFLGISMQGFTSASLLTVADKIAAFTVVAFAQAKFYLLFSFLFGYSLSFLIKSDNLLSICQFKRRLLGLGLLGVLHAVFFFSYDILLMYGLIGCAMLWLKTKSDATIRKAIFLAFSLWITVLSLVLLGARLAPDNGQVSASIRVLDAALQNGSFWQAAQARINMWPQVLALLFALNSLGVLAMFCVGLLAGRHKILAKPDAHQHLWQRGARYGFCVGLPCALTSAYLSVGPGAMLDAPGLRETAGVVLGFATAPFLTFGYVSWLALLRQRMPNILQWCRRAGRMSLTGYLAESIFLSFIFCGYGLGWFGQLGAAAVTLTGLGVWLLIDQLAHQWQRRYQYGPFEWLLRAWVGKTTV